MENFSKRIESTDQPRVKRLKICHINEDRLGLSRDVYATARAEKDARATFLSAIKRELTQDTIVIADGMNYIKGFRYQLFCDAKAIQTPSCVVHVGTPAEQCRAFNAAALSAGTGGYEPDLFDNLIFRYEEPNGMNRWDAPLFTVPVDDDAPSCDEIWEALVGNDGKVKVVRPNAATVAKPASEQNILFELDKSTSEVIGAVSAWLDNHPGEGGVAVAIDGALTIQLPLTAPSTAQLQRHRRQFIQLNRTHTLSKTRVKELFVEYLNDAFSK